MTTTDEQTRRKPDELDAIRDQCGALELALEREADPAAAAELRRELAACRQTAFQLEQRDRKPEADAEATGPAGDVLQVQRTETHTEAGAEVGRIEGGAPRPDYAGLYNAERIEAGELRRELAERDGQQPDNAAQAGGDRERERLHPDIARLAELVEAHNTGYQPFGNYGDPASVAALEARLMPEGAQALDAGLAELAEQHEARLMENDESFSGEVVAEVERENDGRAYVLENDGERVMVPEIEGAEMEVGDDVTVSRDPQGAYEAEAGYDYGR